LGDEVIRYRNRSILVVKEPAASVGAESDLPNGRHLSNAQTVTVWPAFWRGVIGLLVRGWIYTYFWTAASFIYLLLRHDVDDTRGRT